MSATEPPTDAEIDGLLGRIDEITAATGAYGIPMGRPASLAEMREAVRAWREAVRAWLAALVARTVEAATAGARAEAGRLREASWRSVGQCKLCLGTGEVPAPEFEEEPELADRFVVCPQCRYLLAALEHDAAADRPGPATEERL